MLIFPTLPGAHRRLACTRTEPAIRAVISRPTQGENACNLCPIIDLKAKHAAGADRDRSASRTVPAVAL
jgi:hypothetical protein